MPAGALSGKRGAQPVYSNDAIQACLTVKVLFGLPLRQMPGFVASLLELVLEQAGFEVHTATDGNEALAKFAEVSPELVAEMMLELEVEEQEFDPDVQPGES